MSENDEQLKPSPPPELAPATAVLDGKWTEEQYLDAQRITLPVRWMPLAVVLLAPLVGGLAYAAARAMFALVVSRPGTWQLFMIYVARINTLYSVLLVIAIPILVLHRRHTLGRLWERERASATRYQGEVDAERLHILAGSESQDIDWSDCVDYLATDTVVRIEHRKRLAGDSWDIDAITLGACLFRHLEDWDVFMKMVESRVPQQS